MGATEKLAKFIAETGYKDVPEEALKIAKDAFLDCLGAALAGAVDPSGKLVAEYVREMGGRGEAGVIGYGFKAPAEHAALAIGTMAHALDYDDVSHAMTGHPSVTLLPVVLTLGQALEASGKEVLLAYIVGFEVEAKIGLGIGRRHYASGWHNTATLGTMGATAAASKIMGLSVERTRTALGIAASIASGLRQNFGTMTKPLHAGNAARGGIFAARLAGKGLTAATDILEGEAGFCQVFGGSGEYSLSKMTDNLGNPWGIISPGVVLKPYPSCRFSHRAIDGALALKKKYQLRAGDVSEIECLMSPIAAKTLMYHHPTTGLEGKFSLEYCVSVAILDGEVGLKQFADERVRRTDVAEMMSRVRFKKMNEAPSGEMGGHAIAPEVVTVRLKNGKEYSHSVKLAKGEPSIPLSREELLAKYRECASFVLSPQDTERCLEMVSSLETVKNISALMELVSSPSPARLRR
ncbi:MAG: MmgE/PrpD family protein [Chloroflexi bacterium]|nr:MmgE/PrpD family protein [Chloroflexota bacterium]